MSLAPYPVSAPQSVWRALRGQSEATGAGQVIVRSRLPMPVTSIPIGRCLVLRQIVDKGVLALYNKF